MMKFIATYDLAEGVHSEFLANAKEQGWSTEVPTKNAELWKLPNTTLYGQFNDLNDAKSRFRSADRATARNVSKQTVVSKVWISHVSEQPWFDIN